MSSSDATHMFLLHLPIILIGQDFWLQNTKYTLVLLIIFYSIYNFVIHLKFLNYLLHRKMALAISRALCLYGYFYQLNILTRILIYYEYSILIHEITPSNVSNWNLPTPTTADEELGLLRHFDRFRHNHLHSEKKSSLVSTVE